MASVLKSSFRPVFISNPRKMSILKGRDVGYSHRRFDSAVNRTSSSRVNSVSSLGSAAQQTVRAANSDVPNGVSTSDSPDEDVLIGVDYLADGTRIFKYGQFPVTSPEPPEAVHEETNGSVAGVDGIVAEPGPTGPVIQQNFDDSVDPWIESKGYSTDGGICIPSTSEDGTVEAKCSLNLNVGVATISHPARLQTGSEDAYFVEGNWIGLADGISTWAEVGVNSGMYARELMWHCLDTLRSGESVLNPRSVIVESHGRIELQGSCTVVLAILEGQVLKVSNVGDSGLIVVRDGSLFFRTRSMQHSFNNPFSVGMSGCDDPECAEDYSIELQAGDIILLSSDGLFDNVFEVNIVEMLVEASGEQKDPEVAARTLAQFAHKQSLLGAGSTPFREDARAAGQQHDGGKKDDITCIVAYVS